MEAIVNLSHYQESMLERVEANAHFHDTPACVHRNQCRAGSCSALRWLLRRGMVRITAEGGAAITLKGANHLARKRSRLDPSQPRLRLESVCECGDAFAVEGRAGVEERLAELSRVARRSHGLRCPLAITVTRVEVRA